MLEIQGKYCKDIKVFTDNIEDSAVATLYKLANRIAFKDKKVRIMPDCHQGIDESVIGFTSTFDNCVSPHNIGCDIGCGMTTVLFDRPLEEKKFPQFERKVRKANPFGKEIQAKSVFEVKDLLKFMNTEFQKAYQSAGDLIHFIEWKDEDDIKNWCKSIGVEPVVYYKSLATIGGGNHFIEYGENEEVKKYGVTIHTGSRNIGMKVYKKYARKAKGECIDLVKIKDETRKAVAEFNGDRTQIPALIEEIRKNNTTETTNGYLMGDDLKDYLTDMVIAQAYAKYNRKLIIDRIVDIIQGINKAKVVEVIESVHNYLSFKDLIIRKGAISAYEGEKMIIPFNMRDGLAICEGKSNEDWNYSAPHGAGRAMSRSKSKQNIKLDTFKEQMEGIYSTSVCEGTIDEAPDAYKPYQEIIDLISDTCEILYILKPKVNLKATDGE